MPGAKSARMIMIVVAIIVVASMLAVMFAAPGAVSPR